MDAHVTFSGFPTYGFCRELVLYSITSGNHGDVQLEGLDVFYAGSWPKAIHEGNGTAQLFISKQATQAQSESIVKIFAGHEKGSGPFALFTNTIKFMLDLQIC